MTLNTHDNVRCSVTARCVVKIIPGNPLYVYIANLNAKLFILPSFMVVVSVSNAPTGIVHLVTLSLIVRKNS